MCLIRKAITGGTGSAVNIYIAMLNTRSNMPL